jgi:hypothetical protein
LPLLKEDISLIKLFFVLLLSYNALFSASIGVIEKGKMDKFEKAFALITRGEKVISVSKIGFKVRKNDIIKTFRRSNLQIRLKDNTVIKIGRKTTLHVEKYIFDKNNKNSNEAKLKIQNGTFQIKTGEIGDESPKNFKIKTKFSTIGIRG